MEYKILFTIRFMCIFIICIDDFNYKKNYKFTSVHCEQSVYNRYTINLSTCSASTCPPK